MRKFVLAVAMMIVCLVAMNPAYAARELLGFYADPNADANGTPYFMVVNAADGNVACLIDDVNYLFKPWGNYPDANYRITPNSNRHAMGIFYADMNTTIPACRYFSVIVTAYDGNEVIRYVSPEQYWSGSAKNWLADTSGRVDVATFKDLDPNEVIRKSINRPVIYQPTLTPQ